MVTFGPKVAEQDEGQIAYATLLLEITYVNFFT
jgi:hypothetical protein